MDPSVPVDVVEDIIDQAADDPLLLRQLALTCSQFLPRSRYHLLAWHACLRTMHHLEEFCAYLRTNPDKGHLTSVMKLRIPCDASEYGALETHWELRSTILSFLPLLPNLRYLGIQPHCCVTSNFLGLEPDQLAYLEAHTTSITTLNICNIQFPNITEFAQFISAFPALRSLRLCPVYLRESMVEMALGPARERLEKQLHLTLLETNHRVDQSVTMVLLEFVQSTIEDLTFHAVPSVDKERIHNIACGMQALRSITITIRPEFYGDLLTQQILVDTWEIVLELPASPPRIHTISITSLGYLYIALAKEPLVEKSRQLEQFFLRQTSHSIVFTASGTKRRRKAFWTTTLGRYFPELHERGQLMVKCDDTSDAYDMTGHDAAVFCLAVSSDSKWIASGGSWDATIILWDARRGSIVREWLTNAVIVRCLAFSPDSHLLASGCGDKSIAIWDVNEGCNRVATLDGHMHILVACAWSLDGTLLTSGDRNGSIRVWDTESFTQLRSFDSHVRGCPLHSFDTNLGRAYSMYFSPDGRWLAFPGRTEGCKIWDTTNCRMHKTLCTDTELLRHTSFDPSCRRIATAGKDYTVRIWDVDTGEELLVLDDKNISCAVTFSPNGDWVLSASKDGTAKVWDSHTGEQILSFEGHTGAVYSACFSPDGKYVASASKDKTVRLWRTHDGSCVCTFTEHTDRVRHVLFSPDGETLCSGADDGTVVIRQLRDIIP